MRRVVMVLAAALIVLPIVSVSVLSAQGMGQGAIVVRDTAKDGLAPIYKSEDGPKIEAKAEQGDYVGGITTMGPLHHYQFEHKDNGRVHVIYISNMKVLPPYEVRKAKSGMKRTGWMDEKDLATFTYQCGCGEKDEECAPLARDGFTDQKWNLCFIKGCDEKLASLKSASAPAQNSLKHGAEKALTNDDVITLVKIGIGDEVIVAKITQAPAVNLNASVDELVRLKKEGVSKTVIEALVKRASAK